MILKQLLINIQRLNGMKQIADENWECTLKHTTSSAWRDLINNFGVYVLSDQLSQFFKKMIQALLGP